MRTHVILMFASLVGCNWTEFDDLADATWVRSSDEPNVGSRNYATAVLGVTTAAQGGQLAVISDDTPDYSLIEYAADGTDTLGVNDLKLGQYRIAALTDPPLFATDGNGKVALVERSTTGGNTAVVFGGASAPSGREFATPSSPGAVTFAGADVVVAAGNTLFTVQATGQVPCASTDATLTFAALASDGTNVYAWTGAGAFFSVPVAALASCTGGNLPAPGTMATTSLTPAPGARIHLVDGYAVLTAHPPTSRMGQVFVIDLATMTQTDVRTIEGLRSSTVATFGAQTYVVVGVPDRAVGSVIAGQVDAIALDTTTGTLAAAPALQLADAEPESGQLFGRSVTTMRFNGQEILVVAANSEVFAYYKTALYDALP